MAGAAAIGGLLLIVGGTTTLRAGYQAVSVAFFVFVAALTILAAMAWRRRGGRAPGLGFLVLAGVFHLVTVGWSVLQPGSLGLIVVLVLPMLAIGWLLIAATWLMPRRATAET